MKKPKASHCPRTCQGTGPLRVTQTDSSLKELQETMKNGYYQLPIARDSIYFLAPWEGVGRREVHCCRWVPWLGLWACYPLATL